MADAEGRGLSEATLLCEDEPDVEARADAVGEARPLREAMLVAEPEPELLVLPVPEKVLMAVCVAAGLKLLEAVVQGAPLPESAALVVGVGSALEDAEGILEAVPLAKALGLSLMEAASVADI